MSKVQRKTNCFIVWTGDHLFILSDLMHSFFSRNFSYTLCLGPIYKDHDHIYKNLKTSTLIKPDILFQMVQTWLTYYQTSALQVFPEYHCLSKANDLMGHYFSFLISDKKTVFIFLSNLFQQLFSWIYKRLWTLIGKTKAILMTNIIYGHHFSFGMALEVVGDWQLSCEGEHVCLDMLSRNCIYFLSGLLYFRYWQCHGWTW